MTSDLMLNIRKWLVVAGGFYVGLALVGSGIARAMGLLEGAPPLAALLQLAMGVLGGFLAYRWWMGRGPRTSDVHGTARWADAPDIKADLVKETGLIVGRCLHNKGAPLLRYDGPAHLLTLAPTRSGKGVGAIIPNLLTADRSVLVIDPKGENARITARARSQFGPVHVLDPFGVSGQPTASYNPMSGLDCDNVDLAEDATVLADALIYDAPGQGGEAHWNEEAKALITGLILYTVGEEPESRRNLATIRDQLTLASDAWKDLLTAMQASRAAGGLAARAANRQLGKSDREAAGVLSSAQRHTHFLDSPRMTAVMDRSDFSFADLKSGTATVFLVLPPDRLNVYSRWLRLLVAQAVTDMARSTAKPPAPVLFLLDEFAALGRLEPVERAMGLMAGYGMQLWPILQDMHQLKSTYGERAGTFLSNAGLIQIFNVNDVDTATWVSRTIGAMTEVYETTSTSVSTAPGNWRSTHGRGTSVNLSKRNLLNPDEVMQLDPAHEILLRQNAAPVYAEKVRYYDDSAFIGLFDKA